MPNYREKFDRYINEISLGKVTQSIRYGTCNELHQNFENSFQNRYGFVIRTKDGLYYQKHSSQDGAYTLLDTRTGDIVIFQDEVMKLLYEMITYRRKFLKPSQLDKSGEGLRTFATIFNNDLFTINLGSDNLIELDFSAIDLKYSILEKNKSGLVRLFNNYYQ